MAIHEERSTAESSKSAVYPWHDGQWATLTRDLDRLPHALLLHGQSSLGKNAFARRLSKFLLCDKRGADGQACDRCRSCILFSAGNHPDFLQVSPLEDSSSILVDQVRAVIEFFSLTPHISPAKIVIISPAEAMNVNAANSLLKILEEPPSGALLILVSTHPSRVSVTIRSRCTRVGFQVPSREEALVWLRTQSVAGVDPGDLLARAGGAPLAVQRLTESGLIERLARWQDDLVSIGLGKIDPVACAETWKSSGAAECLDWLHRFIAGMIQSYSGSARITWKSLSISIIDLFNFIDNVSTMKRRLGKGVDETLVLEQLLIRWSEIAIGPHRN